jgi:hypothetical protein
MKKWIIGALVGGILTFAWQTISWTMLDLHRNAQQYTPKQDSILQFLGTQFTESGDYFLPNLPAGASAEENEKLMAASTGKPWAKISYHTSWEANMTANIIRGLLVNIMMVAFMVWILSKMNAPSFSTILISCLFAGLIGFINFPYASYIWYQGGGIRADLMDALVQWGLAGIWLGWWLNRK